MKVIRKIGNEELLNREKTLFLCSKRTPYTLYGRIFQWVESLTHNDCVMCFNSSELEDEVMKALVVNQIPTVLVVMNRFNYKSNIQIEKALKEQRMLILILQRDEPKGKGQTPRLRNEYVMQLAEHLVCGYVNKNGNIFSILAGKQQVRYLENEATDIASEPTKPLCQRWTVEQDKILLRMFYADMGLHAIKKQLNRSYLTVRNRIHSITMPEELLKGREFEDFVLELFDLQNSKFYSLLEWRSDKTLGTIHPASNSYPDFVMEYTNRRQKRSFAIECKWRSGISRRYPKPLFQPEQIAKYQEFSASKNISVFVVLGIGGEPCYPEMLYIIPLAAVTEVQTDLSRLRQYQRAGVETVFSIEEFTS